MKTFLQTILKLAGKSTLLSSASSTSVLSPPPPPPYLSLNPDLRRSST